MSWIVFCSCRNVLKVAKMCAVRRQRGQSRRMRLIRPAWQSDAPWNSCRVHMPRSTRTTRWRMRSNFTMKSGTNLLPQMSDESECVYVCVCALDTKGVELSIGTLVKRQRTRTSISCKHVSTHAWSSESETRTLAQGQSREEIAAKWRQEEWMHGWGFKRGPYRKIC